MNTAELNDLNLDKAKWVPTRLGDLAIDVNDRVATPSASEHNRFVGLEHFVSGDLKIKDWQPTDGLVSAAKAFQSGDILFARRNAYLKRASIVDFDGVCSGDAFVLRENRDKVFPGFLAFVMCSSALWRYAISNAAGTMSKRVKWRDLANFEFLLPPRDQQVKLAELLWAADRAKDSLEELSKKVSQTKRSHFAEQIGHRATKGKWPVEKLMNFAKIVRGSSPRPAGSPEFFDGDYLPWVTVGLLTNKKNPYLKEHEVPSYLTEKGATKTRLIPANTVILSNSGFSLGVPSILTFEAGANDGIAAFLDLNGLEREYLYYFLSSLTGYLRAQIAAGADQPNLNTSRIGNLKIPVPDAKTQKRIAAEMVAFDSTINQSIEALERQKGLLKSLLNQVF